MVWQATFTQPTAEKFEEEIKVAAPLNKLDLISRIYSLM